MNRNEMIKWLSENTTREQWSDSIGLEEVINNDKWGTYDRVNNGGVIVLNKSKNIRHGITVDDVFEPVSEQPIYIDGGIYEIGVMNGEPQQFVYNLKLNMFERGSNESVGASITHDSKYVTHFKLVHTPSDTYLSGIGDEQPESLLRPRLATDTEVFLNDKPISDDDGETSVGELVGTINGLKQLLDLPETTTLTELFNTVESLELRESDETPVGKVMSYEITDDGLNATMELNPEHSLFKQIREFDGVSLGYSEPDSPSVLDKQEGGSHYKGKGDYQPWAIINALDLNFYEGNALKYLLRHRSKNGAEDIKKAIHYLEAVLEFEYSK